MQIDLSQAMYRPDVQVEITQREPGYFNPKGQLVVPTRDLEWESASLLASNLCDHTEHMCSNCWNSWATDWHLRFTHKCDGKVLYQTSALEGELI